MFNSYLELNFEVVKKTGNSRYSKGNDKSLVNSGPIALFGNFKLTTSSWKLLEDFSHTHIVSLMYKLLTPCRGGEKLSTGFWSWS